MNTKLPLYTAITVLIIAALAKVRSAILNQVPLGYQDENGFHLGEQKAGAEQSWPSAW